MGNRPSQTIRCSDCTKPDLEIHETQSAGAGQKAVSSKCPVAHGGAAKIHSPVPENYNTRNMMPEISQTRGPDQKINLSTERTVSSIPKGRSNDSGEADNWVYPSPQVSRPLQWAWAIYLCRLQQFFNALKRKGKEAPEDAVPVMVDIHNFINENCWNEIKKWESLFHW